MVKVRGRLKVKVVPCPKLELTAIFPFSDRNWERTISKPKPRPERSVISAAVENAGSKIKSNNLSWEITASCSADTKPLSRAL